MPVTPLALGCGQLHDAGSTTQTRQRPQLVPERARAFAERILGLYTDYLASLAEGPASPRVTPGAVRAAVALDVPEEPLGDDAIVAHLQTVLDHSPRHGSGAFLAYISGAGTVPGASRICSHRG